MNPVKMPCSPVVLIAQWIERPTSVQEVMGSTPVGDSDFSLSHACVMKINSSFTFITKHKIHHLYSPITTHYDFDSANPSSVQDARLV